MRTDYCLTVTALVELGAGLFLLAAPALPLALLVGGAALLAIAVACWAGRRSERGPAQRGLLLGALTYDVVVAILLAQAALVFPQAAAVLAAAVVLHTALAGWCGVCLWTAPRGE